MTNQYNKIKLHFSDDTESFNNENTNELLTTAIFNIIKPTLSKDKEHIDELIKLLKENL